MFPTICCIYFISISNLYVISTFIVRIWSVNTLEENPMHAHNRWIIRGSNLTVSTYTVQIWKINFNQKMMMVIGGGGNVSRIWNEEKENSCIITWLIVTKRVFWSVQFASLDIDYFPRQYHFDSCRVEIKLVLDLRQIKRLTTSLCYTLIRFNLNLRFFFLSKRQRRGIGIERWIGPWQRIFYILLAYEIPLVSIFFRNN